MSGYMNLIQNYLETIPINQLIIANKLHAEVFPSIPVSSYYKSLERCVRAKQLIHLTKGVYYRPRVTYLGIIPISELDITNFFIQNNQGMLIGYRMFNKKGLTTQVSKQVNILSTNITDNKKNLKNVNVSKIDIVLQDCTISTIETLEILQNYNKIEDLNLRRLLAYMEKFATMYSDDTITHILKCRSYKKSTLASLQAFLTHYNVTNSLNQYLSPLSTYQTIAVEELYEITRE
ncbi:MAG: hypothetical protein R3Y24_15420 [Eubacteriales bacterium]